MSDITSISRQLADLIKKYPADYIEAHLEEGQSSFISYRGKTLESIGRNVSVGGNVRALVKGGWGFASFNNLEDLEKRVEMAVRQANLAAEKESQLAPVSPVLDKILSGVPQNPVLIPLSEKKQILDEYNEILWRTPKLQTSVIGYADSRKNSIFMNSAGSFIEQEKMNVTLRISAIAADNGEVQQAGISAGSPGDFTFMRNQHAEVERIGKQAVTLLSAPQIKGGEYTVILDPILAGVFVHEAFGHLSESDFVYENDRMREIMTLGKKFGSPILNIIDGAAVPGLRGSYKYDDEGTPATRTHLIKEGVLVGRLHSRETAAKMGEKPTGNARAITYRYPPIVRMTNTYIEPGKTTFDEMISGIEEGVYAKNWYGGTTSMEMFTFSSGEAYMIRHGKVAEALRPVVLSGNVFTTLHNIDAIGNDLDMNQGGGCGKGGQSPLPVSNGSPHIRISKCLVGGR
ncbi:MAG: TldD/PmbA family protein [Dehalococcoidales bacterium]|nr:TldD/PmbA family protein [Dehalococcoidales bacterium]